MGKKRVCKLFAVFVVLVFLFSSIAAAQTYDSEIFDNPDYQLEDTKLPSGQAIDSFYYFEENEEYDIDEVDNLIAPGGERIRNEVLFYEGVAVPDITYVQFDSKDYVFSMRDYTGFGVFGEMFEGFKARFFNKDISSVTGSASKLDKVLDAYKKGQKTKQDLEKAYEDSGLKDLVDSGKDLKDTMDELIKEFDETVVNKCVHTKVEIKEKKGLRPVDCEFMLYMDDYQIEYGATEDGAFDGMFNHGKSYPRGIKSVKIKGCNCRPVSIVIRGPTYPFIDELRAKLEKMITDKIKGQIEDAISEYGEDAAKKVVEGALEAAGHSPKLAGMIFQGVAVGMELGKPFGELLTKEIDALWDAAVFRRKQAGDIAGHPMDEQFYLKEDDDCDEPFVDFDVTIIVECDERYSETVLIGEGWHTPKELGWLTDAEREKEYRKQEGKKRAEDEKARKAREREEKRLEEERKKQKQKEEQERAKEEARRKQEEEKRRKEWEAEQERLRKEQLDKVCKECMDILEKIKAKQKGLEDAYKARDDAKSKYDEQKAKTEKAEQAVKDAQDNLDKYDKYQKDPGNSYSTYNGRQISWMDSELIKAGAQDALDQWSAGQMSADAVEDYWKKLSEFDPVEMDKLRGRHKELLQKVIAQKKAELDAEQKKLKFNSDLIAAWDAKIGQIQAEISRLEKELEDCLEKCKKLAVTPAETRYAAGIEAKRQCPSGQFYNDPNCRRQCRRDECKLVDAQKLCYSCGARETPCEEDEFYNDKTCAGKCQRELCVRVSPDELCYECKEEVAVVSGEGPAVMVREPTTPVIPKEVNCADYCKAQGMSTERIDHSAYVLSYLNTNGVCAASARIEWGKTRTYQNCVCYTTEKPKIAINPEKMVCKTQLGDVPCNEERTFSCGEGCTAHVSCNWGGWKQVGPTEFVPVAGAQVAK